MGFALRVLAIVLWAGVLSGQTLAHRGWAGSGITVAPWWQGAVLYEIDPVSFQDSKGDGFGDLQGIIKRLDYLQGLSVDAIVLSPFQLQAEFGRGDAAPFDPKYGTAEDLDQLVQEASKRKIRVFVDLPLTRQRSAQQLGNIARFWLSRGIAGLRLTDDDDKDALSAPQIAERMRELRRVCASYAVERLLFWDRAEALPVAPARRPSAAGVEGPQMAIDRRLNAMPHLTAGDVRRAVEATGGGARVAVSDAGNRVRSFDRYGDGVHDVALAKLLAAALMTGSAAPMLYFGQEIGMATTPAPGASAAVDPTPMQWGGEGFTSGVPWIDMGRNASTANVLLEDADADSLLNWYRRLSALRHANAALRSGGMELIATSNPDVAAWVRRPLEAGAAPVLVVCNLAEHPEVLSIAADLRRLGLLPGSSMMHTLASSALTASSTGPGTGELVSGPVSVNSISLPAYGVYIGELARPAGLESAPAPLRHGRRHRTSR